MMIQWTIRNFWINNHKVNLHLIRIKNLKKKKKKNRYRTLTIIINSLFMSSTQGVLKNEILLF
jgi:hypothetical protein